MSAMYELESFLDYETSALSVHNQAMVPKNKCMFGNPSHGLFLPCRGENKSIAQKSIFSTNTTVFNTCVVIKIRKNLLLGVVSFFSQMHTSTHNSPMLRINCLIPTSLSRPLPSHLKVTPSPH
jgi:hypothetical protein